MSFTSAINQNTCKISHANSKIDLSKFKQCIKFEISNGDTVPE
jgi:hypothetical protein